jgi:hypothetical protein
MERRRIRLSGKYRLITRSDFDGLVCGMLLQEAGLVDEVLFSHPKDMQDGTIEVNQRDIIAGLPYVEGCAICFEVNPDESVPETARAFGTFQCDPRLPSVARFVYTWLGGRLAFPRIDQAMLLAVDKATKADYSIEDILEPTDWVLLGFLMDARTGLGRFRDFRLSNYQLMLELMSYCRTHRIAEILVHPDVAERVQIYQDHMYRFGEQIRRCTRMHEDVGVIDLREEDQIWAGNRFVVYALFPRMKVSIHVMWGLRRQNTVFAVGRSILASRSSVSQVDIGQLMAKYGGGGRASAGTCQVPHEQAARVQAELIASLI